MTPTHKTKPRRARAGRPTLPDHRKADGGRLAATLQQLGLSQAEAARRTGIRQSWLNGIANGNRSLGREDLRALGRKLGISADTLLGLNEPRSVPTLASDLRDEVIVRAQALVEPTDEAVQWIQDALHARVDGEHLVNLLAEMLLEAYAAYSPWFAQQVFAKTLRGKIEHGADKTDLLSSVTALENIPPPLGMGRMLSGPKRTPTKRSRRR